MADALRLIVGLVVIVGLVATVLILSDIVKVSPRTRTNVGRAATAGFLILVFWFFVAIIA